MLPRHFRLALGLLAAMAASPASAYVAINLFTVQRLDADRMQVLPRGGLTSIDGWCAVGDYAITVLSLPPNTPIWRVSEPPRRAKEVLVFSFSAEGAAKSNGLNQFGNSTLYLTAAAARAFCPESIAYWTWM